MPNQINLLSWQEHDSRLYLRIDHRMISPPPLITSLLLGGGGHGLTDDPAIDLLRLEVDLRRYARYLAGNESDTAEEVAYGSDAITLASAEGGIAGRRHCRMAFEYFAAAAMHHMMWTNRHRCVRSWVSQLRQFVIDIRVPDGLLAQATAGWQRGSDVPSFVVVFNSTSAFVSDNMDRADPAWWAYRSELVGGLSYGDLWRRDGDDDDPSAAPLPGSGPWRVAYLPQTDEVYSARRTGQRPEEIWLLGAGFRGDIGIKSLLSELQDRMREPNSLILAAQTVHSAEDCSVIHDCATGSHQAHDFQPN
jgi:hypothetical protein